MSEQKPETVTDMWTQHRAYVVDLAFRMLGNIHDAEDVVQDAFGRLLRSDAGSIDDVRGWLVVVVSRLCLDQLRSAHSRRETNTPQLDESAPGSASSPSIGHLDPAERVTLDESIG